jgi:NADH-quinone oxidoreductase subunit J
MIAALQVIVYAGAIMVLFLFVIMLLNLQDEALDLEARRAGGAGLRLAAWLGGAVLAAELAWLFLHVTLPPVAEAPPGYGGAVAVARSLFTDSALPFELTSILLLVAVIGAVMLGQRRTG